jgi:hypothetical protein
MPSWISWGQQNFTVHGGTSENEAKRVNKGYIHTYTHTYIHRYIHTYIRTYIHTDIHTYIHTYNPATVLLGVHIVTTALYTLNMTIPYKVKLTENLSYSPDKIKPTRRSKQNINSTFLLYTTKD